MKHMWKGLRMMRMGIKVSKWFSLQSCSTFCNAYVGSQPMNISTAVTTASTFVTAVSTTSTAVTITDSQASFGANRSPVSSSNFTPKKNI